MHRVATPCDISRNCSLIQIVCTLSTWANILSSDLGKPYFLHGKHPITALLPNQKGSTEGALPDHSQDQVAIHAGLLDAAWLHAHVSTDAPKLYAKTETSENYSYYQKAELIQSSSNHMTGQ